MALQLPPLSLDIEQFIKDVEERPAIWNRSYSCSKSFMDATWLDLSDKHKFSRKDILSRMLFQMYLFVSSSFQLAY